ncbi:ribulokinase [Planomicrobium sp. CPCC 101110]|uniref:ribulokinase n=1 Tax=Planomicrobium sp. CPCC 101110 TaxID=2599619 RepID=UPI0011B70EDC|nr:ribulokinase [Planomicrobium sp. CPCC 101110]TWT25408.1 ribulokinase [Planomicrobium sp. CPCC 101110]
MAKYTIGVDFGTLSGRAILVNVTTGEELATDVLDYRHGVMEDVLPNGKKLPPDWALQHPQDYLDVLATTIPRVIEKSNVSRDDIIGIGVDFTACTILPVKEDGTPLCFLQEFQDNPNSYVKLWKHHAAQDKANKLNEVAEATNQSWLPRYGGKISSEWLFPKVWQILDESPEVYKEARYFIEAADWIVWQLSGVHTRNAATAGYKGMWHKQDGYPDKSFFKALDPRLENVVEEKLDIPVTPIGERAGFITKKASGITGLKVGTAVAVAHADAHNCLPAVKVDGPGKMLNIIGTSSCHMVLSEKEQLVPGICGVVEDGIIPGFFGYEAGQNCVGDQFAWFVDNCVPASYKKVAEAEHKNIHSYLTEKASLLKAGESGLLALDWWNGNRSTLVDLELTGMFIGLNLQTKPEEMYRALIESTAFGTRKIVEAFRENGVPVDEFYATGGISRKNPLLMQTYADVLNMPIKIGGTSQGPALASAIFGAVAAGAEAGGYEDIFEAGSVMGKLDDKVYYPNPENKEIYDYLYSEYTILYDYFGKGENNVMKRLKALSRTGKIEPTKIF